MKETSLIIPAADTWNYYLMLVVDTGIGTAVAGLAVTGTSHIRIAPNESGGNFIMLALEIARIRDLRK